MNDTARTFTLFGCPVCATRWWTTDGEENPGHACPEGQPSGGMTVETFARSTRKDPPWPRGRAA